MRKLFGLTLLVVLSLCACAARAQDPAATTPWVPAAGLWWSPAEHGIYYHVSPGPDGFLFVAITTYRADGEPTFLVMQGAFEPTTRADWERTGVTGRLRSPLYRMEGGSCPGCAYRDSRTVESAFGSAEIEFRNGARAVFRNRGRETPIERFPLFTREDALPRNRLPGLWQVTRRTAESTSTFLATIFPFRFRNEATTQGPIAAYAPPERLLVQPVAAPDEYVFNALAAADDGRLQGFEYHCARVACLSTERAEVHERDGVLYARGRLTTAGAEPYEMVFRRLGPVPADALGAPATPHEQDVAPVAWRPAQGLWWAPAAHGTFHHVSVGTDGFVFAAITTYRPDGEPTFNVLQGDFEPTPLAEWRATGVTGRVRSPLYRMAGGQALGGSHRNPTVEPTGIDAVYEFRNDGRAVYRQDGVQQELAHFPLFTTTAALPRNRLRGRWQLAVRSGDVALGGVVEIGEQVGSGFLLGADGFRDDEVLSWRCSSCDPALEAQLLGSGLQLAAGDAGRLRLLRRYACTRAGFCTAAPSLVLHERDGVLYGRSADTGLFDPTGSLPGLQVQLQRIAPLRGSGH